MGKVPTAIHWNTNYRIRRCGEHNDNKNFQNSKKLERKNLTIIWVGNHEGNIEKPLDENILPDISIFISLRNLQRNNLVKNANRICIYNIHPTILFSKY